MAIDSETKSRSVLANGILAMTVMPIPVVSIAEADSPHILGWYGDSGFPLPPEPPEGSEGSRNRARYDNEYRAKYNQ